MQYMHLNYWKWKYTLQLTLKHGTFSTCVTPLNWATELLSLISIHVQTWLQIPDKTNTWHNTWYKSFTDDSQTVFSAVSITCVRPEGIRSQLTSTAPGSPLTTALLSLCIVYTTRVVSPVSATAAFGIQSEIDREARPTATALMLATHVGIGLP